MLLEQVDQVFDLHEGAENDANEALHHLEKVIEQDELDHSLLTTTGGDATVTATGAATGGATVTTTGVTAIAVATSSPEYSSAPVIIDTSLDEEEEPEVNTLAYTRVGCNWFVSSAG